MRISSLEMLERHPNDPEAAEIVLRAASDYLYKSLLPESDIDTLPIVEAVDLLDDLREKLLINLLTLRDDIRRSNAGR